jgi:hypothetical protein
MPRSDFAPVREALARERERGRPFSSAWAAAIAATEDEANRTILRETHDVWQDAYERKPAK